MIGTGHVPVLLEEALGQLDSGRAGTYIDGTLGLGGHSLEILKRNPKASVIGFDRDETSLREAGKRLEGYGDRVRFYLGDFKEIPELGLDLGKVRGVLLDLGISSFQLDEPERGFSFNADGPLDMRMDRRVKTTAAAILERYSEARLDEVFREYGELPHTRRLAREIVTRRKLHPFATTGQFRRLVEEIYRWRPQKGKIHPAAKAFQALRIEINGELEGLGTFLERMAAGTRPGTRVVIIAFHSLEDRIVKRTFAALASPAERVPLLKVLTKKPVTASDAEVAANSRSRSAKLRAAERV
jgi:16S rRNA (cytosine1402-N4)-methyltransferase